MLYMQRWMLLTSIRLLVPHRDRRMTARGCAMRNCAHTLAVPLEGHKDARKIA